MRNRVYDPRDGRWLQTDPLGFAAGDRDLYRYCNGEYSTGYDPEGLYSDGGWIGDLVESALIHHPFVIAHTVIAVQQADAILDASNSTWLHTSGLWEGAMSNAYLYARSADNIASREGGGFWSRFYYATAIATADTIGLRNLETAAYGDDPLTAQSYGGWSRTGFGLLGLVQLAGVISPIGDVIAPAAETAGTVQGVRTAIVTGEDAAAAARAESEATSSLRVTPLQEPAITPEACGIDSIVQRGSINYGPLDALGRPTGVTATITEDMLGTGTRASPNILPPGFAGGSAGQARGHLLARLLGGSGDNARNLVTILQNPTNTPVMRAIEAETASAVRAGQIVQYSVTPIYEGASLVPRGITISATGSGGYAKYITVLNPIK